MLGQSAAKYLSDKPRSDGLRYLKLVLAGQHDSSFLDSFVTQQFTENLNRWRPESTGTKIEHVAIAFLALILHEVKGRLRSEYPTQELDVSFNVCAPIDHIQSNPLKAAFERILAAAELVEAKLGGVVQPNDLLERSGAAFASDGEKLVPCENGVFVVPESVGAIASYLASLQARNGLHAVYDFGAGTTDVAIFYISNVGKGTPFTYWYSARNLPRGSQRIERLVTEFLREQDATTGFSDLEVASVMTVLMKQPKVLRERIYSELKGLWENAHIAWREAYGQSRKQPQNGKEISSTYLFAVEPQGCLSSKKYSRSLGC